MSKYMEIKDNKLSVESQEVGWTFVDPRYIVFVSTNNDPEYQSVIHFAEGDPLHVKEHIDFISHFLKNRRNNE